MQYWLEDFLWLCGKDNDDDGGDDDDDDDDGDDGYIM